MKLLLKSQLNGFGKGSLHIKKRPVLPVTGTFFKSKGNLYPGYLSHPSVAIDELPSVHADIMIMDANWPSRFSIAQFIGNVLQQNPFQKIILVTNDFDKRTEKLAMDAGAHGYICRTAETIDSITESILDVAKGHQHFPSLIAEPLVNH